MKIGKMGVYLYSTQNSMLEAFKPILEEADELKYLNLHIKN